MAQKLDYATYLRLDQLLTCQEPQSVKAGRPAHDEMLFITVHHTYEIWFKQMLYDLDSLLAIFTQPRIDERDMGTIVGRLQRLLEILKVMVHQVDVLETMTPLDFLEFRDLLQTASGFQSFQFRLFENKLGLKAHQRLKYSALPYEKHFSPEMSALVKAAENAPTLFDCIEKWLERTPFLTSENFDFWSSYKKAVEDNLQAEDQAIRENPLINDNEKEMALAITARSRDSFRSLFDEKSYEQEKNQGYWRLSYKAIHAVLLIQLYREEPAVQIAVRVFTAVIDLDATLTQWRHRHALMVQRMLGARIGTGGSTGADYLKQSTERHRIFTDFFRLTTFLLARSKRPPLPENVRKQLSFAYQRN